MIYIILFICAIMYIYEQIQRERFIKKVKEEFLKNNELNCDLNHLLKLHENTLIFSWAKDMSPRNAYTKINNALKTNSKNKT